MKIITDNIKKVRKILCNKTPFPEQMQIITGVNLMSENPEQKKRQAKG